MRTRLKYVTLQVATGRGVAESWRKQYCKDGVWTKTAYGDSGAVYAKLCDLGPNPPIDKVADAIGNQSWSYIFCEGCGDYVEKAAALGEYETKAYCETCLKEALSALSGAA